MAIFKYKAINSEGQRIEGSQSADSESQIREMLLSNQSSYLSCRGFHFVSIVQLFHPGSVRSTASN